MTRDLTPAAQAALRAAGTYADWPANDKSSLPATRLRFVERGGQRILQQEWDCRNGLGGAWTEWRDVPLETE